MTKLIKLVMAMMLAMVMIMMMTVFRVDQQAPTSDEASQYEFALWLSNKQLSFQFLKNPTTKQLGFKHVCLWEGTATSDESRYKDGFKIGAATIANNYWGGKIKLITCSGGDTLHPRL